MTVSSDRRTALTAQRTALETALALLEANYADMVTKGVREFSFNSGDGSQSAKRVSLSELRTEIKEVREQIYNIDLELNQKAVQRFQISRWG